MISSHIIGDAQPKQEVTNVLIMKFLPEPTLNICFLNAFKKNLMKY